MVVVEGEQEGLLIQPSKQKSDAEIDFFKNRSNNNIFLETSKEQDVRVRANSPFKHLTTWSLMRVIVKSNDDVR
jgi:hypothetical protein